MPTNLVSRSLSRSLLTYPNAFGGSNWIQPAGQLAAPTHYVASTGSNANPGTSPGSPFATIDYALQNTPQNAVIVVLDTLNQNISETALVAANGGTAGQYKVLRGASFGTVINGTIYGTGASSSLGPAYIEIHNLLFNQGLNVSSCGRFTHIKFFQCGFNGGALSGNNMCHGAGNNQLYEGCFWFGGGGRYKSLAYQVSDTIYRGCLFRHDQGWADGGGNPSGCLSIYSAINCHAQQCISVDNLAPTLTYEHYNFAAIGNRGATSAYFWQPFVVDCPDGLALDAQAQSEDMVAEFHDAVVLRSVNGVSCNNSSGVTGSVLVNGGVFQDLQDRVLQHWGSGSETFSYGNLRWFNALGLTAGGPYTNLGGVVNAQTTLNVNNYFKRGATGTLYGENGWNTPQAELLFPIPYETQIRAILAGVSTRGFCGASYANSQQPLTDYIFR